MKTLWKKSPSVYRNGKSFYHAKWGLTTAVCRQNWESGQWEIIDNYRLCRITTGRTAAQCKKNFEAIKQTFNA